MNINGNIACSICCLREYFKRTSDLCKKSERSAKEDQTNADLSSSTVLSRVDLTVRLTSDGLQEFVDEDFPHRAIVFTKENINTEATSEVDSYPSSKVNSLCY